MGRKSKFGNEDNPAAGAGAPGSALAGSNAAGAPASASIGLPAPAAAAAKAAPAPGALPLGQLDPALVAVNPLLALQVLNASGAAVTAASANSYQAPIDPDVQELGDYFNIEDRHIKRLHELMKGRQDTFEADLLRLYDVLERAHSPAGLLVVKMREMEEGKFIGKVKPCAQLVSMTKKFKLDSEAESKLADILARHEEGKRQDYLNQLERHLEASNKPSAMAMMLLKKLGDGQPLGRPGNPSPGSYLDKVEQERKAREEKNRESRQDRDRDRRDRDDRSRRDDKKDHRDRDRRSRSRRR
mmetsp:Transcript_6360/g.13896  ORF Transcript_6360/g.13896 Transcript_6360/m.13896 type:complete len:300 (-) Transcript_6360:43-942(-)